MLATTHLQNTYDWSQIILAFCLITGAVCGALAVIGRLLYNKLKRDLVEIDHKATPNGGNTLNLGDTAARTETKIDELRGMFALHLANHPGAGAPVIAAVLPTLPTRAAVAEANGEPA